MTTTKGDGFVMVGTKGVGTPSIASDSTGPMLKPRQPDTISTGGPREVWTGVEDDVAELERLLR